MTWGDSHWGAVQLQSNSRLPGRHSKAHFSPKDWEKKTSNRPLFFLGILTHMCSILRVHRNHSLCPSIPKTTELICSVHQDPSRPKVAPIWAYRYSILRVHSNHSLCLSIPTLTDLICSVHQEPSRQKVASIWAYMCSIFRVHSNHSLCPSILKFTVLICSVLQDPSRQKVASFWATMCIRLRVHSNHSLCLTIPKFTDLICPVVYIMNGPYIFSKPRTKPSKSGFRFSLYVQFT